MAGIKKDILAPTITAKNLAKDKSKKRSKLRIRDSWNNCHKRKDSHSSPVCPRKLSSSSRSRTSTAALCKKFSKWALFTSNSKLNSNSNTSWWSRWKKVACQCHRNKLSPTRFLLISWASKWWTRGISADVHPRNQSFPSRRTVRNRSCSRRSWCKFSKDSCSKLSGKVSTYT